MKKWQQRISLLNYNHHGFNIFYWSLLGYSCFTTFCGLLLCSKVSAVCIHRASLFGFPPHLGLYRALSRLPWGIQSCLLLIYFTQSINSAYVSIQILRILPTFSPYLGVHTHVLYVCITPSRCLNTGPTGNDPHCPIGIPLIFSPEAPPRCLDRASSLVFPVSLTLFSLLTFNPCL